LESGSKGRSFSGSFPGLFSPCRGKASGLLKIPGEEAGFGQENGSLATLPHRPKSRIANAGIS
jgi:hypothetical protein